MDRDERLATATIICAGALIAASSWQSIEPPRDAPSQLPPVQRTAASAALLIPVEGVAAHQLRRQFAAPRSGGRRHEAIDILAPRHTPVLAAGDGRIARLAVNELGGLTIHQLDAAGTHAYYYAHLQRYAHGLKAGATVRRGDVIGFVGTSGNAPANTPHLHFAVYRLGPGRRLWQGTPLDPYPLLVGTRVAQSAEVEAR